MFYLANTTLAAAFPTLKKCFFFSAVVGVKHRIVQPA